MSGQQMTLIDAIETLQTIADLEEELALTKDEEELEEEIDARHRSIAWLEEQDVHQIEQRVRTIFRLILKYLKDFQLREHIDQLQWKEFHRVKSVMLLVGEAAYKLDAYTRFFHGAMAESVTHLREYKELHDFYFNHLVKEVEQEAPAGELPEIKEERNSLGDLERIKRDRDYELFFIRGERGHSFVSPLLAENIKLICDFEPYGKPYAGDDPLIKLHHWHEKIYQVAAQQVLHAIEPYLDTFFHEVRHHVDMELAAWLNEALIALILAGNPRNLMRNLAVKPAQEYFVDFQTFLRQGLISEGYQKLAAYPHKSDQKFLGCLKDLAETLCHALYVQVQAHHEVMIALPRLIREGKELRHEPSPIGKRSLTEELHADNTSMNEILKQHPNGPLFKLLDVVRTSRWESFDLLLQGNLPDHLFDLVAEGRKYAHLRLASPTTQEYIHSASVAEEFKAYLRACKESPKKQTHLLINLQDRTSWKEHARAEALEKLQESTEFADVITVVTLDKNSDFYHQQGVYAALEHAEKFKKQFYDHLSAEQAYCYFPPHLHQKLFPEIVNALIESVHRLFFESAPMITQKQRCDFIEIFYLFLELKLLDIAEADYFSLTCKDAVDCGLAASASLFAGLKLLEGHALDKKEKERLWYMAFVPPLLIRERAMDPERFQRMISMLELIEAFKSHGPKKTHYLLHEEIFPLYQHPMLSARLALPPDDQNV